MKLWKRPSDPVWYFFTQMPSVRSINSAVQSLVDVDPVWSVSDLFGKRNMIRISLRFEHKRNEEIKEEHSSC